MPNICQLYFCKIPCRHLVLSLSCFLVLDWLYFILSPDKCSGTLSSDCVMIRKRQLRFPLTHWIDPCPSFFYHLSVLAAGCWMLDAGCWTLHSLAPLLPSPPQTPVVRYSLDGRTMDDGRSPVYKSRSFIYCLFLFRGVVSIASGLL